MDVRVVQSEGGIATLHPAGRVDLLSAGQLRQALLDAVEAGHRRLVVDLGDVPFIDSSGLASLISGLKAARQAGGDLRIARPTEQAQTVFQLTRLDRVLRAYPSIDEALASY